MPFRARGGGSLLLISFFSRLCCVLRGSCAYRIRTVCAARFSNCGWGTYSLSSHGLCAHALYALAVSVFPFSLPSSPSIIFFYRSLTPPQPRIHPRPPLPQKTPLRHALPQSQPGCASFCLAFFPEPEFFFFFLRFGMEFFFLSFFVFVGVVSGTRGLGRCSCRRDRREIAWVVVPFRFFSRARLCCLETRARRCAGGGGGWGAGVVPFPPPAPVRDTAFLLDSRRLYEAGLISRRAHFAPYPLISSFILSRIASLGYILSSFPFFFLRPASHRQGGWGDGRL
jgi:hypothetical protein